ncbi:MAG TPA: hypothetical protein DDZ80_27575 [Cyanobacteria bacterium UBA8803]|nr:hypothetical protein [Cyanobacteria bacterium UBA9273]HBL62031.1 hypothetical protein [Cyanobacteria bacterium UBA8803]
MDFLNSQEKFQLLRILTKSSQLQTADERSNVLAFCGLDQYCGLVQLDQPLGKFVISIYATLSQVYVTVDNSEKLGLVVFLEYLSQIDFNLSEEDKKFIQYVITKWELGQASSQGKQQLIGTRLTYQEDRNRQILLNKVRNSWVNGVLEKSLHDQALIELGLEERFNAVNRPVVFNWETPDQDQQPLPPDTKVIDQFDQLGIGRTMLILGEPGAGKTITLVELARDLVDRAQQDVNLPIPVVLNLSSWQGGKHTIADWLVSELYSQYQVPKQVGKSWMKAGQLLLLLDGLDEVNSAYRDACVQALNQLHQEQVDTEMVVCSRIKDYESLRHRLNFQAAIYIQPLTSEQVQLYLADAGAELAAVSIALRTDIHLQELVKSPLMLNIITLAYRGMSIEDLPSQNLEERRQHLFNAYIDRMFSRRVVQDHYPEHKAKRWLTWLAQRMVQQSKTVFLIERMQPSWLLSRTQTWVYRIGFKLIVGWLYGLSVGLFFWRVYAYEDIFESSGMTPWWVIVITSMLSGLISGLIAELLSKLNCKLIIGLAAGLVFGISGVLVAWLFEKHLSWNLLVVWLLIESTICGAGFWLIERLISEKIEPVYTTKFSWLKARSYAVVGLFIGLVCVSIISIFITKGLYKNILSDFLIWVLFFALIGGFQKRSEVERRTIPNQGILQSATNAAIFLTLVVIISVPIWWLRSRDLPPNQMIPAIMSVTLSLGIFLGLVGSGGSGLVCLQHFIMRIILWWNGYIPWNYARFLNYATKRIFLQKVGGGYIFIHRLLLEHFASFNISSINL